MASLLTLLALFVCFFVSSHAEVVPLTGNDWVISNNQSLSAQGQVPGTIHTILLAAKLIPDPYLGYNDVNLRYLVYSSWTFRKNFSLTDEFLSLTQFTIHFDQIDTVANITLNGCFIGRTNSMFIPYSFNVTRACLQSNNELRIDFESPVIYAANQAKAYNETVLPACPAPIQHGECHVQFIRKEICSFSWDWGPAFAPIGIPGNLYIQGTRPTDIVITLESVNVASYQKFNNQWRVDVLLSSSSDPFVSELNFVLQNTSFTYQSNITFNQHVSLSFMIPNDTVQLWWPNGYGNQTLYTLSVYNQGQLVGSRLIGFRTVELAQHTYGPNITGLSFYFVINGHPIFIKGSNWVPPDAFRERVPDETLERLFRSAQLVHMNILRISAVDIYESDSFYEMADRLGIMIWHDLMFGNTLYPMNEPFLMNVRNEVLYQMKRLQSHVSLVMVTGNNEIEAAIAQNWFGIPADQMAKAKDDYRTFYLDVVMRAVQEVDKGDNRIFVVSSPSNGLESISENYTAKNPQDPLYGDVHFYGYTSDTWNPDTYPITRFLTETGLQALPSLDSWYQVTQNITDLQFHSAFVQHREHSPGKLDALLNQIQSNLPLPVTNNSLQEFIHMIYLSQITQAMTLKSFSDVCRVHSSVDMIDPHTSEGHTMGMMYWQINDIWQAPTWATIEYGLKWKMGHYYVQHMFEPVYPLPILTPYLASVTDENARLSLYLISELFSGTSGRLICSFLSLDTFTARSSVAFDVSISSPDVKHITDLPYATVMRSAGCSNSSQCIFHCRYNSTQEDIGQTVFLTQPKNYQLYQPNLRIQSTQQVSPTEVSITITATRPALFVWLDVSINISGYFSRNGFHMFEATRTVSFHSWSPMSDAVGGNLNVTITSLFDVTQR